MPFKSHEARKRVWALYRQRVNKEARAELADLLGGCCVKCGYDDQRGLAIDHVNGGGSAQRRKFGGNYYSTVRRLVREGSKDYQILCFNCNEIKKRENREQRNKIHFNAG